MSKPGAVLYLNLCPCTRCCSHTSTQYLKGFSLICSPSCSVPLAPGLSLRSVSLACHALQWRCGQDHVSSAWLSVPFSPLWNLVANTWENTSGCCSRGKNFQKQLKSCGTVRNHNVGTSEWSCRSLAEVNLSAQSPYILSKHMPKCQVLRAALQSHSVLGSQMPTLSSAPQEHQASMNWDSYATALWD